MTNLDKIHLAASKIAENRATMAEDRRAISDLKEAQAKLAQAQVRLETTVAISLEGINKSLAEVKEGLKGHLADGGSRPGCGMLHSQGGGGRPGLTGAAAAGEEERRGHMTIDDLLDGLLKREGGFVDNPADRGGPTNFGITQATLTAWLGRPASTDEVRTLDEATAREIYVTNYLTGPRIDQLPDAIVPQVFDCAVNHGPKTAIRFVQRVLNEAGFGPCDVDGVCGPDTRARAERAQAAMGAFLTNAIVDERLAFYDAIVARDPSQAVFLRGWRARAESFRVEA